jgi:hypothetical protein
MSAPVVRQIALKGEPVVHRRFAYAGDVVDDEFAATAPGYNVNTVRRGAGCPGKENGCRDGAGLRRDWEGRNGFGPVRLRVAAGF